MEGRPLILEKKVPNRFLASLAAHDMTGAPSNGSIQ